MIPILIYCHVIFFNLIIYYVRLLLCYVMYFVLSSSCSYRSVIINVFLAKLTSIFVFNICLNSPASMFGNLCFDLVSKFELVNEQNYGTDVEQFKSHDKRFILHCVRFRSAARSPMLGPSLMAAQMEQG